MKFRKPFVRYLISVLTLIGIFFFLPNSLGQDTSKAEKIYKKGEISEALHASMTPDNRTVGVYISVAKQNKLSPQEWASTVDKYFTVYGFPVKIILDDKRPEGKGAVALIYVGAKAYEGNLSSGGVSLYHLLKQHEKVFGELVTLYKKANPEIQTD